MIGPHVGQLEVARKPGSGRQRSVASVEVAELSQVGGGENGESS